MLQSIGAFPIPFFAIHLGTFDPSHTSLVATANKTLPNFHILQFFLATFLTIYYFFVHDSMFSARSLPSSRLPCNVLSAQLGRST